MPMKMAVEAGEGTTLAGPTDTFTDRRVIEMGDFVIEVLHLGPAHSPGDISVWLPQHKLVIAGDMAFHERLLPIFDDTDTAGWLDIEKAAYAVFGPYLVEDFRLVFFQYHGSLPC